MVMLVVLHEADKVKGRDMSEITIIDLRGGYYNGEQLSTYSVSDRGAVISTIDKDGNTWKYAIPGPLKIGEGDISHREPGAF